MSWQNKYLQWRLKISILEKAYELGQEILLSEELNDMRKAEQSMLQDEIARNIV